MSSFFLGLAGGSRRLRRSCVLLIGLVFAALVLHACLESFFKEPAEHFAGAIRLTKGNFEELQFCFHPSKDKLLFLRKMPESSNKEMAKTNLPLERRVFELDFTKPDYPVEHEIKALRGGSYPSYLGENDILALDRGGTLVIWHEGLAQPEKVELKGLQTRPAKPVGSPDGKYIAFLSIPPAKSMVGEDNEENFRYQAFVASVKTGESIQLSKPIGLYASVVSLSWANKGLFVMYQILERKSLSTRVEKFTWPGKERILALFTDFPPNLSLDGDYRFFATLAKHENHLTLISRGMDVEKDYDFKSKIKSVLLRHDGKYAVFNRYCKDSKNYNLFLLPVSKDFLAKL